LRSTPSAEVNSVMIRPHPPRFRMKRRKTVSVTPAMGARTVAGVIWTPPMERLVGTGFTGAPWRTRVSAPHELSQNFFTVLFYLAVSTWPCKTKAPALREGLIPDNRLTGNGHFLAGAAAAGAA